MGVKVVGRVGWIFGENLRSLVDEAAHKVRHGEQRLHHAVHVARVAQVLHAGEAGPGDRLQLARALRQNAPFADALIVLQLQLDHGLFRFLQLIDFDAEMGQMLNQLGILDHVVLGIAVHVALAVGRDGAQLHGQRVLVFVVIFERMAVAARPVEHAAAAHNRAVGQIQPQIIAEIAFLALPSGRRDLFAVVQLLEIVCVCGHLALLAVPCAGHRALFQFALHRVDRQNGFDRILNLHGQHTWANVGNYC